MQRFNPDQAARHMEGLEPLGDRSEQQKALTESLLDGARAFAGLLTSARDSGLATGDPEEIEAARSSLDDAVGAAFRAMIDRAEPAAQ